MSKNSYVTKCSHRWCLLLLYGLQWDLIFHLGEIKLGRWRQRKHWIYVDFHPQTNFAFPRNADERKWMNGLLSPWHHSGLRLSWLFLMTRKVMHNRVKANVLEATKLFRWSRESSPPSIQESTPASHCILSLIWSCCQSAEHLYTFPHWLYCRGSILRHTLRYFNRALCNIEVWWWFSLCI